MQRVIVSRPWSNAILVILGTALAATSSAAYGEELSPEEKRIVERFKKVEWVVGPGTGDLGNAKVKVPAGFRFCGREGAREFCDFTQNVYADELGVLMPVPKSDTGELADWFVLFTFNGEGYVKDDDKGELNDDTADTLLKSFQAGTERNNDQLRAKGWPTLSVSGWHQKPFYDQTTNNLTWAIIVASDGMESVNYDSRVLGRRGYMTVKMVLDRKDVATTVPQYQKLIGGLTFASGESYSEYREGDKVAKYGLVGLLGGGAAVAAVKWWKPLMKFGIFILAGIGLAVKKVMSLFPPVPVGDVSARPFVPALG